MEQCPSCGLFVPCLFVLRLRLYVASGISEIEMCFTSRIPPGTLLLVWRMSYELSAYLLLSVYSNAKSH